MSGKDKFSDIEQLIAEFEASGLRELHARRGDLEIYLSTDADAAGLDGAAAVSPLRNIAQNAKVSPVPADAAPAAAAHTAAPLDAPAGSVIVRAPYLGTFYRAPKPGAAPYVEVGQTVDLESELCLVEVMKLFTAVRAECAGTVYAILVQDGEMVAAEQPLFVVIPA